ncbi:MAG: MGMT family protein [Woeseiaceae bacterium]|nr:MGMT family protein [Woeseiaceae bacterium]
MSAAGQKLPAADRAARIIATVRDIPPGRVASYGQVAELAGIPRGARQVGAALRQLPAGHDVPWHRVITASGRLAFDADSESWHRQKDRLAAEGIALVGGRVSMVRYRWQPDLDELLWKPSAAWDDYD